MFDFMRNDYKYEIQIIAEELAEEEYYIDYYSLGEPQQVMIFQKAEILWAEMKAGEAEEMNDRLAGF
jgi:hypothetical protein